jgi:hypothetical protein
MARMVRPLLPATKACFQPSMWAFVALIVAIQCRSSTSFAVGNPKARAVIVGSSFLSNTGSESEEPDLFEYFDPLLSPHAYPDGISPNKKPVPPESANERFDPPGFDPFGLNKMTAKKSRSDSATPSEADEEALLEVDPSVVFDPRLSPHLYANGVPSVIIGDPEAATAVQEVKKVGVLLMDHGSKNPAANQRLLDLARIYQDNNGSSRLVVRAAHMEIASPSIPEGLQSLLDAGVDEIVCHPYFLSPGRHVVEDIPEILKNAIETLKIDIPITTTDPVGSNTEVMIGAIHSLVQKSSTLLPRKNK